MSRSLPEWVKPEAVFSVFGKQYEVRAVVDDRAVLRYWTSGMGRWAYAVEDEVWFHVYRDDIERPQ